MSLQVRILGCGSSGGVPRLGEGAPFWGACDPDHPKNRRSRCSILVTRKGAGGETRLLVDTSPDMREQLLAAHVGKLDAVLITHDHADQLHGIDDLRVVTMNMKRKLDLFSDRAGLQGVRKKFNYCFETPAGSEYPPILIAHEIPEPFTDFTVDGPGGAVPVRAFGQRHGRIRSLGYRFGPVAYSPDADGLDDEAFDALAGVECWIVDALRHTPHPSHAHLERTLEWIARVKPKQALLTNMHVDMDYETLRRELPPGIEPAYDGMILTF
ncbi:MAG TPA: MBL fold metallo-hydrolase [Rhizomicrobium sp.]|nr:MBL fold metallo-hydrolase [Rhizomicrobium sp.]